MHRDALDLNAAGAKLTPHFPPIVVNRAARRAKSRLRVVLLNAAGGREISRNRGVSEASAAQWRRRDPAMRDQCGNEAIGRAATSRPRLAATLEMSCVYIPEFGVTNRADEIVGYMGNAILSAAPFDDVIAVAMHRPRTPPMLRRRRRWSRIGTPTGLVTRVNFGGKELTVGVAHLHSRCTPAERARQMATYLESFPATGRAIFGGDLNTTTTELSSWASLWAAARQMIANPRSVPRAPGIRALVRSSARASARDRWRQRGQSPDFHFLRTDSAIDEAETRLARGPRASSDRGDGGGRRSAVADSDAPRIRSRFRDRRSRTVVAQP